MNWYPEKMMHWRKEKSGDWKWFLLIPILAGVAFLVWKVIRANRCVDDECCGEGSERPNGNAQAWNAASDRHHASEASNPA